MKNDVFFKKTPRMSLIGAYHFFGVKRKSYAASIIERIYDYYCRDANNLYVEYFLYYRKEFTSFDDFLSKKYNLFLEEIEEKRSLLLCHKSLEFEANGQIDVLLEDETIRDTFERYIGGI